MLNITIDSADLVKATRDLAMDQLPFATKSAINDTLLQGQGAVQEHMSSVFSIRRQPFAKQSVKIRKGDFATKDNLVGTLRIEGPNQGESVFAAHEIDWLKQSVKSTSSLAVPANVRRTKADVITKANRPKAFNLRTKSTKGGIVMAQGDKGTFEIKKANGQGAIYQRKGKGKSSVITTLYALTKAAAVPARLRFEETVTNIFGKNFFNNYDKRLEQAMRTAR